MGKELENTLYYGDNLRVLREHIADNSIDLIYLDPPFQSGRNYNVLFEEKNGTKSSAQINAFEDTWHWNEEAEKTYQEIIESKRCPAKLIELVEGFRKFLGNNDMMAYLVMMAIRLVELHRVLKDTGSIYLHCDTTASHYLKLIMDSIFGINNFQNEIIWYYRGGGVSKKRLGKRHDTIFFYTKGDKWMFNPDEIRTPYSEESLERLKYKARAFRGDKVYDTYEANPKGKYPDDVWEMQPIMPSAKERLGYPTQKPEALLERIIKASSKEKDIVLDPFCGCGTTVAVAQRLKRRWLGIDITHLSTGLIKRRLSDTYGATVKYKEIGFPEDYSGAKELAEQDKYQFQWWVLFGLICGRAAGEEKQKGADRGIDGYIYFYDNIRADRQLRKIIIQIKGGHIGPSQIRDLKGVLDREKAQIGAFITLEKPTREMIREAASSGFYKDPMGKKYPRLQILTIEDLLKGEKIEYPSIREDVTLKKAQRYVEGQKITQHKLIED